MLIAWMLFLSLVRSTPKYRRRIRSVLVRVIVIKVEERREVALVGADKRSAYHSGIPQGDYRANEHESAIAVPTISMLIIVRFPGKARNVLEYGLCHPAPIGGSKTQEHL